MISFARRIAGLVLAAAFAATVLLASGRPRIAILTDIGGDPDDVQSMVRFLHYSNEFEVELLIATAVRGRPAPPEGITRPELIHQLVDAYSQVLPNLSGHANGWPTAEHLRSRIMSGNRRYGRAWVGDGHETPASHALIKWIDAGRPDRRLNIAIWGGQTDFAQALWQVKKDRGATGWAAFVRRFRVYDIEDQDELAGWMRLEFPGMFYILAKAPAGCDKRTGTYRGMYLTGDEALTSRVWVEGNVRSRSVLGSMYPGITYTNPNPHACLKEGDTPAWFFFLPQGGNDPADPARAGWGGRFEREPDGWFRDLPAKPGGDPRETVSRWRPDFQRDFARRTLWAMRKE